MNALAIHLYLTIRYINLSFNYFGNFYRIIEFEIGTNNGTDSVTNPAPMEQCGTMTGTIRNDKRNEE